MAWTQQLFSVDGSQLPLKSGVATGEDYFYEPRTHLAVPDRGVRDRRGIRIILYSDDSHRSSRL